MRGHGKRGYVGMLVALTGFGIAGCGPAGLPTAEEPSSRPLFALGGLTSATPVTGMVKLCKAGNVSGAFSVTRVAQNGGTGTAIGNVTIAPGTCVEVALDNGGSGVGSVVTYTESPADYLTGVVGQQVNTQGTVSDACAPNPGACVNGGSIFINSFHGYTFTFTNTLPPPPTGGQGCSPGYWKNHAGPGKWPAGYAPGTLFSAVFENAFGSQTLLQVLNNGGGGLNALGRHTVSALLNAAALPGVFEMTPAAVIAAFNGVYPGTNAQYNTLKGTFEALIDVDGRICPFN